MLTDKAQIISIMQEQLALQRVQLEKQRQQAKEQLEQAWAQAKTLLQDQFQQAEAHEEKLIHVLTDCSTNTMGAHLSFATRSIPKFALFDASGEL